MRSAFCRLALLNSAAMQPTIQAFCGSIGKVAVHYPMCFRRSDQGPVRGPAWRRLFEFERPLFADAVKRDDNNWAGVPVKWIALAPSPRMLTASGCIVPGADPG